MAPKGGDDKKRILMFNVSGFIGTVLFFYFYEFVVEALSSALVPGTFLANYKVTIAWTFSNLVSILWQHSLHRYLVYGHSKPYFQSLVGTYAAYSVSIVLSHFAMMGLEKLGVGSSTSWLINIVGGGVMNYYLVSKAFD